MGEVFPRVSVGLPVYNGERFIREALDSLVNQTYRDFELIISDNASTDRTAAICKEYAERDRRIHVVRTLKNEGAAPNFNRVFRLARGEYFKWASADDLAAPDFLEKCLEVLENRPDIILAYPKTTIIDENSQVKGPYHDKLNLSDSSAPRRYACFQRRFMGLRECNAVFGLIRTDVLRKTRLIDAFPSSDIVLLSELALLGKFYEIPGSMFYRRDHSHSSIRANPTAKTRSIWFDSHKPQIFFPRWKIFLELFRSIGRMGMRGLDWLRCVYQLRIWYGWNRKRLGREIRVNFIRLLLGLPKPVVDTLRWLRRQFRGKNETGGSPASD